MMNENFAEINGQVVDVTTVMDKTVKYVPTNDEAKNMVHNTWTLLDRYFPRHLYEGNGLWNMFGQDGVFWKNKGWLISAFQKHPQYNGNYQIVLRDIDMCRHINQTEIRKFMEYALDIINEKYNYVHRYTGECITEEEYRKLREKTEEKRKFARHVRCVALDTMERAYEKGVYARGEYYSKRERISDLYWRIDDKCDSTIYNWNSRYVFDCESRAMNVIWYFLKENQTHLVSDELETEINRIFSDDRFTKAGQKISRLVGKIAKRCGLDKHTDIRTETFYTQSGEARTRTKDYGYNYMFAQFADAINPITIKATAVISVNPMDFYTMSFGDTWASCHTIDKRNERGNAHGYGFSGMYCSGTESYLLDSSSVVFYFIPNTEKDTFNANHPEYLDKVKRCMFYLGEDKLIQSRVYPDGRDGGEKSLAGDIRTIMQKVIADIFEVPNLWKYVGGTSECNRVTTSAGTHYRDYLCYNDCGVCYLRRIDGYINKMEIEIGHNPICPECGETHNEEDNVFCYGCQRDDYEEEEEDEEEE